MKLTKDDKEALKSLAKHPGWAVLRKIEEENRILLTNQFLSVDLEEPKNRLMLREHQIYCKARSDFMLLCETNVSEVIEAPV